MGVRADILSLSAPRRATGFLIESGFDAFNRLEQLSFDALAMLGRVANVIDGPSCKISTTPQVETLKASAISQSIEVAAQAVSAANRNAAKAELLDGKPKGRLTADDLLTLELARLDDPLKKWHVRQAGVLLVRGYDRPPNDFPATTTADDIDRFLTVADEAYPGVIDRQTIDPPLLPVEYDRSTFAALKQMTGDFFGARVLSMRVQV